MIIMICCLAALAAITAFGLYALKFGIGFAPSISDWGAVGDFFGGVLNPTFALLSLILIAYTLMQNKKALDQGALALEQSEKAIQQGTRAIEQNEEALRVSNKELALTRNELANSATALEEQAKLLAVQSFETTFFNMLNLHRRLIDNIFYDHENYCVTISRELRLKLGGIYTAGNKECEPGLLSINRLLLGINNAYIRSPSPKSIISIFNVFYKYHNREFGNYFRNMYQILKLVQRTFDENSLQKKYSNILRAQLSNQELSLLLLNCLCPHVDKGEFRLLVIHFELLEHLDISYVSGNDNIARFTINNPELRLGTNEIDQYLQKENGQVIKSAFGQNSQILKYCRDRNIID